MKTDIVDATSAADFEVARALFREYAERLGVSLCFQGFEQELQALDRMYVPPSGALLLLRSGGEFVGCVGLRRLGDECEMKRLYVRETLRGQGWGRRLAEAIAERAALLGYRRLYLDTLPQMTAARALYRDMGFAITEPYYMNPVDGVAYMVKPLA
jgi:ribosomal protein S18 acetylase RimI-like enzyme